jgi:hypothetical protein
LERPKFHKIKQSASRKPECIDDLSDRTKEEAMIGQARFKSVQWMLLAVFALAPTAVLAQQDKASQGQTQQNQAQPAAQAKTEAAQTSTETAQTSTEATQAKTEAQAKTEDEAKLKSVPGGKALGMSILGNQEAPTSLVIVPWKTSELGNTLGISTMLDDSRLPIDKEVFMRMLSYYEIRSGTPPTNGNAAQPATAADRRKQ